MKALYLNLLFLALLHIGQAQNIVQAEYFLDTDLGFGKNKLVNLTPSADGTFSLNIATAAFSAGNHQLYIRTKDAAGHWSLTTRRMIEIIPAKTLTVTGGEYFFDQDPGFGKGHVISVSPQDSAVTQNFTAVIQALDFGYHKLYIRVKDVNTKWSQTVRRNVEVVKPQVSLVSGAEYFFVTDNGVGQAFPVNFNSPSADSSFTFNVPLANIPTGATAIYVRARDSVNRNWSLTARQTDSLVTSVQSGLWSDVNTWSNHKIPVSSTVVILHHNVTVDIIAFCRSLAPYRNDLRVAVNQGMVLNITGH